MKTLTKGLGINLVKSIDGTKYIKVNRKRETEGTTNMLLSCNTLLNSVYPTTKQKSRVLAIRDKIMELNEYTPRHRAEIQALVNRYRTSDFDDIVIEDELLNTKLM